jgi:hypothetical protein
MGTVPGLIFYISVIRNDHRTINVLLSIVNLSRSSDTDFFLSTGYNVVHTSLLHPKQFFFFRL